MSYKDPKTGNVYTQSDRDLMEGKAMYANLLARLVTVEEPSKAPEPKEAAAVVIKQPKDSKE